MCREKAEQLRRLLRSLGSVLVACSGGIDSSLLMQIAHQELGDRAVAATAVSPSLPAAELAAAQALAQASGWKHIIFESSEMDDERYSANQPDRCYRCKQVRGRRLLELAHEHGLAYVADGSNADDLNDYRPGLQAAQELGLRMPLQEVGLTKNEIRRLARAAGLPNWDMPSKACLASRVPYGIQLTAELLQQVEQAEAFLERFGLRQVRVRHHNNVARLEVEPEAFGLVLENREAIVAALRRLGYDYVALDLGGYNSGSLNRSITEKLPREHAGDISNSE